MSTHVPEPTQIRHSARSAMLRIANKYQEAGLIYEATDAYTQLACCYPDTMEGREAAEKLLELAQDWERQGMFHQAIGIYEKLESFD